jgi:septum formation protein
VRPSGAEELEEGDPAAVAAENARRKAAAVQAPPGVAVLGVDTVVALDGRIYGKPLDEHAARETLRRLGGRTHEVISGLAVDDDLTTATTAVTFRALDAAWIEWYVATGEWVGRAGGYAIQGRGAALVTSIQGDYLNVVGLPVAALIDVLGGGFQRVQRRGDGAEVR